MAFELKIISLIIQTSILLFANCRYFILLLFCRLNYEKYNIYLYVCIDKCNINKNKINIKILMQMQYASILCCSKPVTKAGRNFEQRMGK